MKKFIVTTLFFLFIGQFVDAKEPLVISLKLIPEEQVLGCPVQSLVVLRNDGNSPIRVPPVSQSRYVITIKSASSEGISFNKKGSFEGNIRWEPLKPGEERPYEIDEYLWPHTTKTGVFKIYAEYNPLFKPTIEGNTDDSIISSTPISLCIKEPSGKDKEAYEYFKGMPLQPQNYSKLLLEFPTSIYAAYAACSPNQWTSNTDPERIIKSIETETYLSNGSVPDDTGTSKDGHLHLSGKDLIAWRAKWIGIVLKNHPDIWYADHLKLRLAIDQVALKKYQTGESDLEKLSREAMPEVSEKAKAYLSLMKQKGWTSAPVEKSVPEAVVVK